MAVMAAHSVATRNFFALAALNTETEGKFRANYYIFPGRPRRFLSVLIHKVSNQVRRCDDPGQILPINNGYGMKPVATEQLRGIAHSAR